MSKYVNTVILWQHCISKFGITMILWQHIISKYVITMILCQHSLYSFCHYYDMVAAGYIEIYDTMSTKYIHICHFYNTLALFNQYIKISDYFDTFSTRLSISKNFITIILWQHSISKFVITIILCQHIYKILFSHLYY